MNTESNGKLQFMLMKLEQKTSLLYTKIGNTLHNYNSTKLQLIYDSFIEHDSTINTGNVGRHHT